ncbi:beta-mannosidase [Dactylosporangium darangshiense]
MKEINSVSAIAIPHSAAGTRPVLRLDRFQLAAADAATPVALKLHDAPDWIPASVPGGVHESLLDAGRIGHPYFGDNEHAAKWVEDATWWYRTEFDAPVDLAGDERLRLVCDGLDTVASVWLNGELLGTHESQFRPAVFDVTGRALRHNELLIRFTPPLAGLTPPPEVTNTVAQMKAMFAALAPDRTADPDGPPAGVLSANLALTLRRKATFSWGWDFAPRLPSIGVTRPVELYRDRGATIAGHHVRAITVDTVAATAQVAVDVEVDAFAHRGRLDAAITLTAPDGRRFSRTVTVDDGTAATVLDITDAALWWTHDLGGQPRYDVSIQLAGDDGAVLDRIHDRVGLRTIALDRAPDGDGGRLFRFVLNGVPLFARGANWVPASMMTGSVSAATVEELVRTARRGNMTMLRVWGGGSYEQDAFYRACDDVGILVWQDFMFACVDYPSDDPVLHAEVVREAAHQVQRLRNRASLALWAGNNEVHAIHQMVHRAFEPGNWGWSFFHDVLPAAVARFSPEVPYWPGSPWADSDPRGVNGVADGDRHAWEVWHGMDVGAGGPTDFANRGDAVHFHRYRHDRGRFISEFGLHAAPELGTLRRWTAPGSLALHNDQFNHRNKDTPKRKGDDLMSVETGLPANLEQYVDYSMACQAEGLKFGIEHYRRRQPHCSGTLIWQFNDPWPGLSWSIVDHDLIPKAGFYFAQRAYRPVLASFTRPEGGGLQLWVTNSGRHDVNLDLRIEVTTFTGVPILDERLQATAAAGTSRPVWSADDRTFEPGPDRYAYVSDAADLIEPNRLFFAPLKELRLGSGWIDVHARPGPQDSAEVTLTSHGYNYLTRVLAPRPGVVFSRNYLDLRDGGQARIHVRGLPDGFDTADLHVAAYGAPQIRYT